ncbi:DUF1642 domain-containing protein [uncultured Streptococcus sp.]|uniref:DUF1642 domain-containing protein n=1 Tax=uncultured Streptococcus sp. TaxID=83427 RepID=UPI0028D90937|nr:DUF1642 domain-containing protein [uncultured Streptococcus sp.]
MNKQELIDYCNALKESKSRFINCIDVDRIIDTIKQLDEPKPVKVPPFVAVWYEINKENLDKNIAYLCLNNWGEFINDKTLFNWMSNTDNFIQILINMHQFGYEVEKERRYRISMPKTRNYMNNAQFLCEKDGKIFWCGEWYPFRTKFTRKQLEEADFGWVFDCPGIEIEEVEL